MSNFNVKVVGTADVRQMAKQFAMLEAQVDKLNSAMAATVAQSAAVDPAGYARMAQLMNTNASTFRNAALSTKQFEVHQLRLNSATDEYVKKLQKQKISFREWRKDIKLANAAYREQLAMRDMVVRKGMSTIGGRQTFDVVVPQQAHKDLDTLGNRIGWIREQTKSAATQMVNWGKNTQWAGRQLMVGFTMPVLAFGAATGVMAYQVDKQMVRIQKVYNTTADANNKSLESQMAVERELAQVREDSMNTAIQAAREYGAAGTDTLSIQADLAATGLKGAKLQKTTNEIMRISTLGEMEHQDALNASIALQSVFKMSTEDLAESFNYMNAVENATSLQLADFAQAIPIAAAPVKQFGGDIKELGVLLTAMRENGIAATQGANAIKAAMQRLGRPSKQVREEFESLTGASLTELYDKSDGLVDLFTRLNEVTRDLDPKTQTKVFAGLFGTYQVTRMSAMLKGMQDLEDGVGQVSDAFRLGQGDAKDWADAAEREVARMAKSASGRFKIALETLKLEMADMGEPFIEIGGQVLGVISSIAKAFNNLPDGVKKFAAYAMIAGALIGPIIMLAGLFGNLIGNLLKFGVAITGVLGKMEILDRDSRAAKLAAELAATGFQYEASAVEKLRHELNLLVQSQKAANRQSMALVASDIMAANPGMTRSAAYRQMADARRAQLIAEGRMDPTTGASIRDTVKDTDRLAGSTEKVSKNWKKIGTHVGVAASGLAMMMMMGDGAVSKFGELLFYGMLLGPALMASVQALKLMGPLLKGIQATLALNLWATKLVWNAEKARLGTWGAIKAATVGAGKAMWGMIGIAGAVGIAVAAVGYGLYKLNQKIQDQHKEQIAQQKAIADSTGLWAKQLGLVERKYKTISGAMKGTTLKNENRSSIEIARSVAETDQGKRIGQEYNDADEQGKRTIALQEYLKVLGQTNGTAKDAQKALEVMFMVAGDGMLEAQRKARDFATEFGDSVTRANLGEMWAGQITQAANQTVDEAKIAGTAIGKNLADAIASASNPTERNSILANFGKSLDEGMTRVIENISPDFRENLASIGVDTGAEIEKIMTDFQGYIDGTMSQSDFMDKWNFDDASKSIQSTLMGQLNIEGQMSREIWSQAAARKAALKEIADQLGIEGEIESVKELQNSWEWQMFNLNKKRAKVMWQQYLAAQDTKEATTEEGRIARLNYLNELRRNAGMRETGELADGMGRATKDIYGNVIDWKNGQDGVNKELAEGVRLTARQKAILESIEDSDIGEQVKNAMSSYQQHISDATMSQFESQMDSAISGMESRNDAAIEAQENRQQAAMDRFDKHWENRIEKAEKFHDKRIAAVQSEIDAEKKADDTRQRLFDAEMARLDRLNQMANRNIDFNVALNAGNFDEAAKIRNDAEAEAAGWALSDANDRADRKAEKRTDRLEKQVDRLEKIKDKRLDALKEIEDAEREALQRTQDRRKKALKEELDATLEAEKKKWEAQKTRLEDALDNFLGYTATSDKDLRKHMAQWEDRYGKFNLVTEGMFNASTDNIAKYLKANLKESQREFANERDWQLSGAKIANSMLQGAFGMSTQDFREFLTTGVWPDGKTPPTVAEIREKFAVSQARQSKVDAQLGGVFHTGGIVGKDKGGQNGVPVGHRDEVYAKLLRGEGVINKDAMAKLGPAGFYAINSGQFGTDEKGVGGAGPGMGFAGIMGALMARAVMSSIGTGILSGMSNAIANQAVASNYTSGKAGSYGSLSFDATQLKFASTIASVGDSMGMSSRDIQIGIMTAITESMLRNVNYGDRDSLGLFQQRPSMGWGTPEQVTDPVYAAKQFFNHLKGIEGRANMSPWLAAQAVQRSAYSDGSNYKQYWDEAQAIFGSLTQNTTPGVQYAPGRGGWHIPAARGYGWGNTHDYQVPIGTPLFAVSDGTIIESRAITSGGSPGNGLYPTPYRSYGETVAMRTASGDIYRWAHMSPGTRIGLGPVKGGTMIGRSGNTGNSSGPHVHMDVNGNYDALGWLRAHGIGLKTGGFTMSDGLANLHKEEVVIDPKRTKRIMEGIDAKFANEEGSTYNVNMYITEPGASADEIADKAVIKIRRMQQRRPQSRKVSA